MALFQDKLLFFFIIFSILCAKAFSGRVRPYKPPSVPRLTDLFPHIPIDEGFDNYFGGSNVQVTGNGSIATLALDKTSGSGLASKNKYYYGFFSAAIKLPSGLTPGVVVAFYMSNADVFPHNHDEIDIELLGHEKRKGWALQTNIYANGSVSTGREEKFNLWFDPTAEHHNYTILWNNHHIVFLVDNIPVREMERNSAYPSKPMSVYATIWDGSDWATHGGKYPVNYKLAPFIASFTGLQMSGCAADPAGGGGCSGDIPAGVDPGEGQQFTALSTQQRAAMEGARRKLMFYSYCKDTARFKVMPPECK